MPDPEDRELYRRISQLENDVTEIKETLERLVPDGATSARPSQRPTKTAPAKPPSEKEIASGTPLPPPPARPAPPPATLTPARPDDTPTRRSGINIPNHMRQSEFWLKIVGIGLTLFGVAFAFKYSIEQGWITPPVRHLFGLGVGLVLLILGLRLYHKRRPFAQVLLGGGIGAFYITGFSAFQLFGLVSVTVAFGFMIAVTLAAFSISIKQNDAIFSLIGTAGGLGTPFLLYTQSGSLPGLVGYTCLLLVLTSAVYFFKGWRLLAWLSAIGGWIVLALGLSGSELFLADAGSDADRWAMQSGALFVWLNFWLVPLMRRVARLKAPDRWRGGLLGIGDKSLTERGRGVFDRHLHLLSVVSPLLALAVSVDTWPGVPDSIFGWAAAGAAVLYWLAARYLRTIDDLGPLSFTHAAAGVLLLTISFCLLLEGDTLLFVLAGEAATLHLIARRLSDRKISGGGHALFVIAGTWLFLRLIAESSGAPAVLNMHSFTDLWVIAITAGSAFLVSRPGGLRCYLIGSLVWLALFFYRELSGDLLFFVLTLEAASFYLLARRFSDEVLEAVSHAANASLGLWLAVRLVELPAVATVFLNYQALVELALIASGLVVALLARKETERRFYLVVVHLAVLAWLARELLAFDNGQGYVSIVWGGYGALLLIAGLRRNVHGLRLTGLGTLMLVVAKLFVVDLTQLETIWRVLLFVGFGGVFLALSYYFPKLWKAESKTDPD